MFTIWTVGGRLHYKRTKSAATIKQQAGTPTPCHAESESAMEISPSEPLQPAGQTSQVESQTSTSAQSTTQARKRPLESPSKGQGKKASLDAFGLFREDLRARKDNDKLQAVSKDNALKKRAYSLQYLQGNLKDVASQETKAIKLQDKQPVFKIWDSLQGTSSTDTKSELLSSFKDNFKDIYNS